MLRSLSHDVSSIEAVLNSVGASLSQGSANEPDPEDSSKPRDFEDADASIASPFHVKSRLAQGSAADLDTFRKDDCSSHGRGWLTSLGNTGQATKRKRTDTVNSIERQLNDTLAGSRCRRLPSKNVMPPPPRIPTLQPFMYVAQVPQHSFDPALYHDSTHTAGSSLPTGLTTIPNQEIHTKDLGAFTRGSTTYRGFLPPTPTTQANNHGHPLTHGLPIPPRAIVSQFPHATGPADSTWPKRLIRAHRADPRASPRSSPPLHPTQISHHLRAQRFNHGSLQNPPSPIGNAQTRNSINRRFGPASSLGLSGNARSSGRQPSLSSANGSASSHRLRFGDGIPSGPYSPLFPHISSDRTSRAIRDGEPPVYSSRTISYMSSPINVVKSRTLGTALRERNVLVEQDRHAYPTPSTSAASLPAVHPRGDTAHRRSTIFTPQSKRDEKNCGKSKATDLQASALRRRANR